MLREALAGRLSPETRRRIEVLLADGSGATSLSPPTLRALRVVQVLAKVGDAPARALLRDLADRPADPWSARAARAALARLSLAASLGRARPESRP
jgi:hypothetical protein